MAVSGKQHLLTRAEIDLRKQSSVQDSRLSSQEQVISFASVKEPDD